MARKTQPLQVKNIALDPQLNGEKIAHDLARAQHENDVAYNIMAASVATRTQFKVKLPKTVEGQLEAAIAAAAINYVQACIAVSDLKALQLMYMDQSNDNGTA